MIPPAVIAAVGTNDISKPYSSGAGTVAVADAQGAVANATVIGSGGIALGGRVGEARLMTNGSGTIDAAALDAGDLVVRLDGPGTTNARARYTARVTDTGLGRITVPGEPTPVTRTDDLDEHWSHLRWGRRALAEARRFSS